MKIIVQPHLQGAALGQWRGAQAKLWMFHVTHNRFALMLFRRDEPEVLYVVAVGCKSITGPFSWGQAGITIIQEPNSGSGELVCRVLDKQAGFELVCSSATLVRGPATELDNSFDNFLGDAPHGS